MALRKRLICQASDLADGGTGAIFEVEHDGRPVPAFAVRYQGTTHAYLNRCAHVAMELDWRPGEFFGQSGVYLICATHGAMYAPDSGKCLGGPCRGGALVPLEIEETGGKVFLIEEE